MSRITVVAAILEQDRRVLICQRRQDRTYPGKWEFPGGKVEPGEQPPQALSRELEEELGIRAVIGQEVTRYEYAYPGRAPILLIFYQVTRFEGELRNLEFARMDWVERADLPGYDFLDGDVEFVKGLATSGLVS
jgi:8-oxo-dGTP diphosphatase